jgi:hypothetical protein
MKSNDKIESPSPRVLQSPLFADDALKVGPALYINVGVDKRS